MPARRTSARSALLTGARYGELAAMTTGDYILRHTHAGRLAERHYAHLAPSYIGETVRANFTSLGDRRAYERGANSPAPRRIAQAWLTPLRTAPANQSEPRETG